MDTVGSLKLGATPTTMLRDEGSLFLLWSLQSEKAHVGSQIANGVKSISPSGEYDKMIDQKIAQIKSTCGIQ
jgi:hypothetical protein